MKREKQPYPYPACIGFYKACATCDGDESDPTEKGAPCAARDGCRLLLASIGGPGFRDRAAIAKARETYPAHVVARNLAKEFKEKDSQKIPRRRRSVEPRPQRGEPHFNSLVIAEAVVERAVEESGLRLVDETKRYKRVTDCYLSMRSSGKEAALYWATNKGRKKRKRKGGDLLIAEFALRKKDIVTIQVNCADFDSAYALGPPPGVAIALWSRGNVAPRIALSKVEPATARASGSWIARVIANDLIGASA